MPREVLTAIGLGLSMLVGAICGSFALIIALRYLGIKPKFQLFVAGVVSGLILGGVMWKITSFAVAKVVAYRRSPRSGGSGP